MNTRMHHLSRLGALLALAFGAAHVHAQTTYTVPLAFNISLEAPVCSLTVSSTGGSSTVDKDTVGPVSAVTVNLTQTPLLATATPIQIVNGMTTVSTAYTSSAPAIHPIGATAQRRLNSPPTALAKCSNGTAMTARLEEKASAPTFAIGGSDTVMAGSPASGQSGTLPIGMLMGLAKFANTDPDNPGRLSTTSNSNKPRITTTANGSDQAIVLTAMIFAHSGTTLTSSYAGLWTYSFNVNLDF